MTSAPKLLVGVFCTCFYLCWCTLSYAYTKADCLELIKVKGWKGTYSITGSNVGTASSSGFGYQWNIATSWTADITIDNLMSANGPLVCDIAYKPGPSQYLFQTWYFSGTFSNTVGASTGTEIVTNTCSSGKTDTREEHSTSTQTDLGLNVLGSISLTDSKFYIGDATDLTDGGISPGSVPTSITDSSCMPGGSVSHYTNTEQVGPTYSPTIVVDLPGAGSGMTIKGQRTYTTLHDLGIYSPVWESPTTWTETWDLKPYYVEPKKEVEDPCLSSGSIIGCENQSLGEAIGVAGTPYRLHYQSNRASGTTGAGSIAIAYAADLGGWTLNVHHRYDPTNNILYLGSGAFRSSASLGTVTASANSGFLIGSEGGQRVYEFDSNGVHLKTRNALTGATLLTFGYDDSGRLISVTDGSNPTNPTTFQRNAVSGKLVSITGPYGQVSKVTLDKQGYLTSLKDPAGKSVKAKYLKTGLMTAFTNARGSTSSFTYDTSGLLVQDKNAAGGKQTLATNGDTVTHTSAMGHVTTYQTVVNTDGSIDRTVTEPTGLHHTSTKGASLMQNVHTSDGMQFSSTPAADPRFGNSASIVQAYTAATPGGIVNAMGASRSATLNGSDPLSLTQQTETLTRNGNTHTSIYDAASKTFTDTSAAGRVSTRTIDSLGRTTSTQITELNPVSYTYDPQGRLASVVVGSGLDARTTSYAYDANGYLASVTDPLVRTVSYTNDKLGRPLQTTLPDNNLLKFAYDADGNMTKLTNQAGKSYGFTYGKTGQLSALTLPVAKGAKTKQTYIYNKEDQFTGMTRLDGTKLTYDYDITTGRLNTITAGTGTQARMWSHGYDTTHGQLNAITSPNGVTLGLTHDGQLLQGMSWMGLISGQTESVGFTYNSDFQVASVSVNGSNPISYVYDADGLMTAAGTLTLQRNTQNGLRTGSTLGDVQDAVTYNPFGEMLQYAATSALTGALMTVSYVRDKLGRITQRTESLQGGTAKTYDYTYDAAGRLTGVADSTTTTTYSYDKSGNRTGASSTGGTNSIGAYDAQDRLLTYGDIKYAYNKNAEVASRSVGNITTLLTYNALGNLVGAMLPDGTQIDYVVDGMGMRIGRKVNGILQQAFLYEGSLHPVAELDDSGSVVSRFVYATHVNVPDYMIKSGVIYRIVTDHVGSPRLVVNTTTGEVVQRMDYDEFGNVLDTSTNLGFQPFGFAGGLYDPDTHLLHYGTREYDSKTGRWLSQDPIGFKGGSINLYTYGNNDPINKIDPTGLEGFMDSLSQAASDLASSSSNFIDRAKDVIKDAVKDIFKQDTEVTPPSPGKEFEELESKANERANDSVIPFYDDLVSKWNQAINALSGEGDESCPPDAKKPRKHKFTDPMKNPNNFRTPPELDY